MWVIPAFDELEHRPTRLFLRAEGATVQQFTLQCGEEALAQRIVVAVSNRSHRRPDTRFPAAIAEGDRGVLAALIGVVDHPRWAPLPDCHPQGVEDQLSPQVRRHGPAHHSPAPGIHNDGQVQRARPGRDVGWS